MADVVTFQEALSYARGRAMQRAKDDDMVVLGCGVELAGTRWQWWYKLGWKR